MSGWKMDVVLARSLGMYRCFRCGGVLLVYHLCPCCAQLVHPGCEHVTGELSQVGSDGDQGFHVNERKERME